MQRLGSIVVAVLIVTSAPLFADQINFSTGDPDGLVATRSRIPQPGVLGIETADDFVLGSTTSIFHATFTGLLTGDTASINDVNIDLYHVFPTDSDSTRTPNVVTRVNSPADPSSAAGQPPAEA